MDENKNPIGDSMLKDLAKKIVGNFLEVVKKENDLPNILLKGHLLIETFLEELLAVLDINIEDGLHRLSFRNKVRNIQKNLHKESAFLQNNIKKIIPPLFALNDVRNNLAHDYNFSLSEKEINKIGINLGSHYILQKYNEGHQNFKSNLLFCIETIIEDIGIIIYQKIVEFQKIKYKQINSNQKSQT